MCLTMVKIQHLFWCLQAAVVTYSIFMIYVSTSAFNLESIAIVAFLVECDKNYLTATWFYIFTLDLKSKTFQP